MKNLWIACAIVCTFFAPGAHAEDGLPSTARIEFGALALDYDANLWTREGDTTLAIRRENGGSIVVVGLSVADAGTAPCSIEAMEERARSWHAEAQPSASRTLRPGDLDVHVGIVDLACRNWAGAPVAACAVTSGKLHLVQSIGGCADLHYSSAGQVLDLLEGLALR